MTVYSIGSRWSRPSKHFTILTDGSRRTAAGWTYLNTPLTTKKKQPHLLQSRLFRDRGPWRVELKQYLKNNFLYYLRNSKETDSLTPRGGFFDGLLHSEPMEPSVKTFHDSDRREPPNSRGMDVLKHTFDNKEKTTSPVAKSTIPRSGPLAGRIEAILKKQFSLLLTKLKRN